MKNNNRAVLLRSAAQVTSVACVLAFMLANVRAADPSPAPAAAPPADPVHVDVYQDVRILSGPNSLAYPRSEQDASHEGWVSLTMMISPTGKPYEASVVDSSGNAKLEAAALKALDQMHFQPAMSGKTPVDSGFTLMIRFLTGGPALGASEHFILMYKQFLKAFNTEDRGEVDAALAQLRAQNLYEDAFRSYAQFNYDRKWGTEAEQAEDLGHALVSDGHEHYLPRELYDDALLAQFSLQVKRNDYGSAMVTWKNLKPRAPAGARAELQRVADQITAIQSSDRTITTAGYIGKHSWDTLLFKNRFAIGVRSGAVTEIKLRCKKKYFFFKYEPDVQYTVSPNAGQCFIEVVGDPGTELSMVQS